MSTFFVVSARVSELVKSNVGAVNLWVVLSIYIKCTKPGNSSRYLLMVREVLVDCMALRIYIIQFAYFDQIIIIYA